MRPEGVSKKCGIVVSGGASVFVILFIVVVVVGCLASDPPSYSKGGDTALLQRRTEALMQEIDLPRHDIQPRVMYVHLQVEDAAH